MQRQQSSMYRRKSYYRKIGRCICIILCKFLPTIAQYEIYHY